MMLALLLFAPALADLPVHCLRHQVEGSWRLHLGPLSPQRSNCGHVGPDTEAKQPDRVAFLQTADTTVEVKLTSPNVAHMLEGNTTKVADGPNGTWTMVYDEGFYLEAGGKSFFAFNHFALSNPESAKGYFQTRVHGKKVYRSVCGQTEVGWYQDKATGHWGCFAGERSDLEHPEEYHDYLSFLHVPKDPAFFQAQSLEQHGRTAEAINTQNRKDGSSWEAAAYPRFAGMSLADLNRHAGPPQFSQTRRGEGRQERSFMATSRVVRRAEGVPEAKKAEDKSFRKNYPEGLDWRQVNGTDWLTPVTDQGDCGSCYVVSSTNMLSARQKIQTKDAKKPPLSISFPLYCADTNQGCQGGYPFLVTLWGQGVGLLSEECADRYHVKDGEQCPAFLESETKRHESSHRESMDKCSAEQGLRVDKFGYIGGYYGGCSEEAMMASLSEGPITIAVEPGMDFMYYRKGVYSSIKKDVVPNPVASEWVKVDHAIMMVGWGVDKTGDTEKPYWILQNSWGPDWGEEGFMRIARGENESGVEFQAVEATVTASGATEPLHAFLTA